jgi:hypothetical protein
MYWYTLQIKWDYKENVTAGWHAVSKKLWDWIAVKSYVYCLQ